MPCKSVQVAIYLKHETHRVTEREIKSGIQYYRRRRRCLTRVVSCEHHKRKIEKDRANTSDHDDDDESTEHKAVSSARALSVE